MASNASTRSTTPISKSIQFDGNKFTCMFETITWVGHPLKQFFAELEEKWLSYHQDIQIVLPDDIEMKQ